MNELIPLISFYRNGNFRSYRGRSKYDENDWNVNNRKKRQYAPYVTRNEQVPIISTTGQKQQNEANYNPIQHSSSYSVQQPSLISNQLLSQSFIECMVFLSSFIFSFLLIIIVCLYTSIAMYW